MLRRPGTGSAAHAEACADGQSGAESDFPEVISPFASYELALALTLTGRSADAHLGFAIDMATKLPKTAAALEAGEIDIVRARIIAEATNVLSKEHTAAVEDLIFPRAGQQTSGQLRAALARAVLSADPDAARRRREEAQRDARVLRWREDAGTAALCGRDLPSAEVLAADQRISARARELKSAGIKGTMDELRARAYLDFLLGRDSMPREANDEPQQATPANDSPAAAPQRAAQAALQRAALQQAALQRATPQRAALQRRQSSPGRPPSERTPVVWSGSSTASGMSPLSAD